MRQLAVILAIGTIGTVGVPGVVAPRAAEAQHQHPPAPAAQTAAQTAAPAPAMPQMRMDRHDRREMMARAHASHARLDQLVTKMQSATGTAKTDAIAELLAALVEDRKNTCEPMMAHMQSMMGANGTSEQQPNHNASPPSR